MSQNFTDVMYAAPKRRQRRREARGGRAALADEISCDRCPTTHKIGRLFAFHVRTPLYIFNSQVARYRCWDSPNLRSKLSSQILLTFS